jgi:hypothetical protein
MTGSRREKRKQEKAAKRAENGKLGWCHGCGKPWTKLTFEHVPPKRVQALIPDQHLRFNPLESALKGKGKLPPCVIARGGLQVKSFGECCQQLTQSKYGQPFFDWSRIVLEMCKNISSADHRLRAVVKIEPLSVIKQIAAMVLAAAEFNSNNINAELRRFVQDPAATGFPPEITLLAYANPIRTDYQLPQCRLIRRTSVSRDMTNGEQTMVIAEISVPPLGYAALYTNVGPLPPHALNLMSLNHFGRAGPGLMDVAVDLPIRTPLGPFPMRFLQDAEKEPHKV